MDCVFGTGRRTLSKTRTPRHFDRGGTTRFRASSGAERFQDRVIKVGERFRISRGNDLYKALADFLRRSLTMLEFEEFRKFGVKAFGQPLHRRQGRIGIAPFEFADVRKRQPGTFRDFLLGKAVFIANPLAVIAEDTLNAFHAASADKMPCLDLIPSARYRNGWSTNLLSRS